MRAPLLLIALVALGCTSARVTATIDGEPVCPDFELGASHTKFKGALRHPVKISVYDGKTMLSERVALGKRSDSDKPGVLVVQDANDTYKVRFVQCPNEFAAHPIDAAADREQKQQKQRDDRTSYTCGEAEPYKQIDVTVRTGHPETRVIPWQAPPNPECLASKVPPAASSAEPAREPR